jgi:hypothetical protein
MAAKVRERRPPDVVVRALNPLLRVVLGSRFGRLVKPLAVLEFTGRRTQRRYRVVTGWYQLDGDNVVFSPARWRLNFAGSTTAQVRHRGTLQSLRGVLVTDAVAVGDALNRLISAGTSPRTLGLWVPPGHRITSEDVVHTRRAMIRFTPTQP